MFTLPYTSRACRAACRSGLVAGLLMSLGGAAHAQTSVLTQHNDGYRDGLNAAEYILSPTNVNKTDFGLLFKFKVDDQIYAQPLYMNNLNIGGGYHNVVFTATTNNSVYAFDADTGTQYWHVNLGTAYTIQDGGFTCTDILATAGIMSTPVIDSTTNTLYVVAQTYVGGVATHKLHALNLTTGADNSGSPVTVTTSGFDSAHENQRAALLLANGNIYIAFAGHCDQGAWKGYTLAYKASTLAQVGVFDASPNDNGASLWQSGNGPAVDASGNVYLITGNGTWDGETDFSESFLKTNSTLGLLDWHTPSDYAKLDDEDEDLTASGPLLIPGKNLVIGGGKDGVLHLVNTASMGHLGDGNAVQNWQATSSHIHSLNFWNNNLYIWGQADYMQVFAFNGSTFNTTPKYRLNTQAIGHPGGSISLSANGLSNGILWASTNTASAPGGQGAWHGTEPGILYAYNATDMSLLWTNEQNASRDDCNNYAKFTAPTIVNGKVYLPSFGTAQTASGQVCVFGELPSTFAIANGTYVIVGVGSGKALEDPGYSGTAGENMEIYTVNNGTNQQWKLTNLGNNIVTLTNGSSGQLLDVAGASKANSALAVQEPSSGQTSQQWSVVALGGGKYQLNNVNSGEALDVEHGGTGNSNPVDQYPYGGNTWQQWTFQAP